jgi:hypothetical protein
MRPLAALLLLVPVLLAAQAEGLDEGRLQPSWFGAGVVFQPSKALGFQWLKPGLDLHRRSLRLKGWEPSTWILGPRALKDRLLMLRMERRLGSDLERGLRRGLKGALSLSAAAGDVVIVGQLVDALGEEDGAITPSTSLVSFDVKLVDGDTGELLGAFHQTLMGMGQENLSGQFGRWCEDLGRLLAGSTTSAAPAPIARPAQVAAPPAFDLEGALRRIQGLRRDGLLSEAECQALRKKAAEKAK